VERQQEEKRQGRNAHHAIVFATDWLIVAREFASKNGGTIRAPEFVRVLNNAEESAESQEAERFGTTLIRLKQCISN
jgi:hypothetical protein